MKFKTLLLLFIIGSYAVNAQSEYKYTVDLQNIVDDRVKVELLTPSIKKSKAVFYFPKMVPGTYAIADFGRFIGDFVAEDNQGKKLSVERKDDNTFVISEAKNLSKITYWVDDTFDQKISNDIYGMSGTGISPEVVVLNGHGFFGYFDGMKAQQFELTVKKPVGFYGSTAMAFARTSNTEDVFVAESYNYLVDMPMLYCKPDTTTVKVGNAEVLISVNSPGGNVTSQYIAENFSELLLKDQAYMGGRLPVDKYAFLMNFVTGEENSVGNGALEHNYSSLYVLPDIPQEQWIQQLKDIAAHEFFHVVTPLNLHSKEIHYFDFNKPEMSQHLWMYEGVTEYFSHHSQLAGGLTDLEHFLETMDGKIANYTKAYDDELPFTKMSKGVLGKYEGEYGNVYEKGALIGFMVDVLIRKNSNGEKGIMDLMNELKTLYGSDKPFKDKKLFNIIAKNSYPEVKAYLKKYVSGTNPLPLQELFGLIGVAYEEGGTRKDFTFGSVAIGFNQESGRPTIISTAQMNEFGEKMGYQQGDDLISINGFAFPKDQPFELFKQEMAKFEEGKTLEVEVARKNKSGTEEVIKLSAPMIIVDIPTPPHLETMQSPSTEQLKLREAWMNGAKKIF